MRKIITTMKSHPKVTLGALAFLFAFFTILLASVATSFLYPQMSGFSYYHDGNSFFLMGVSMAQGKTPYVEIFDHKGLYIFYYTALGAFIGRTGVFFLQVAVFTVTYFFLGMTLREFKVPGLLMAFAWFLFFGLYVGFGQGPADPDLILPLVSLMMYFYARGLRRDCYKDFMWGNFVAGIGAGVALNIRLTDAMVCLAFVVFFGVKAIKDKQFLYLARDAAICIGGMALACLPPFIHAYVGHFFPEMIEAILLSNFRYVGASHGFYYEATITYVIVAVFLLSTWVLVWTHRKQIGLDGLLFFCITSAVTCAIQIAIAIYPHYLIIMFGFISGAYAYLLSKCSFALKPRSIPVKAIAITMCALALGTTVINPVFYWRYQPTDEANLTYLRANISEEDKAGHVLFIDTTSAYYTTLGIEIGFPDFACQSNHIGINASVDFDHLKAYAESADCHFFITIKGNAGLGKRLFESVATQYEIIEAPATTTIQIYRHAI